jgi:hypothetical protein
MEYLVKLLWTFESKAKIDPFIVILEGHGITYEITSKNHSLKSNGEVTIAVDEDEYEKAKRLLMRHRKRRTSGDYL